MIKSKFTESEIIKALKENEQGNKDLGDVPGMGSIPTHFIIGVPSLNTDRNPDGQLMFWGNLNQIF